MSANYKSIILAISLFFVLSASISVAPGDLDPTFGNGGIVITRDSSFSQLDYSYGMAIQSDGKIVVVGDGNLGTFNWDFAVIRYNPNGSLDTSFNGNGIVITSVANSDYANSVAIQTDGKIVVAGGSGNGGSISDFALVRYNTDGSLDNSFNGTGKVITPSGSGAGSVAIEADGKIIAVGGNTLVRYNPDGTLDTSFNGTGKVSIPIGSSKVAIQSDGKIVAAGNSHNGINYDFAVVRYNSNGSLDSSFGGTGQITIPVGNSDSGASSVAIQRDGKIVAAGGVNSNNIVSDFAVVRLNPSGSLDSTFNGTGKVITPVTVGNDIVTGAAIQADGKIVVAGMSEGPLSDFYDFVVVRYLGDGATPTPTCPNPIDCADLFVRQHYLDFLGREPDDAGLAFWTNEIESCGADARCREVKRINVSAAFFLSIEFQETGYFVHRLHKVTYGNIPGTPVPVRREEFLPDVQQIGFGVQVGVVNWAQQIDANKNAYADTFASRARFTNAYPEGMDSGAFVDQLNANAGGALSQAERDNLVNALSGGSMSRAQVLRAVTEDADFAQGPEKNRAFVLAQYFGYLRRNPDDIGFDGQPDPAFDGYTFWLDKLNQFNGNFVEAEMVKAFISSAEYRRRFGQP